MFSVGLVPNWALSEIDPTILRGFTHVPKTEYINKSSYAYELLESHEHPSQPSQRSREKIMAPRVLFPPLAANGATGDGCSGEYTERSRHYWQWHIICAR